MTTTDMITSRKKKKITIMTLGTMILRYIYSIYKTTKITTKMRKNIRIIMTSGTMNMGGYNIATMIDICSIRTATMKSQNIVTIG